jgi:hypothetical protein
MNSNRTKYNNFPLRKYWSLSMNARFSISCTQNVYLGLRPRIASGEGQDQGKSFIPNRLVTTGAGLAGLGARIGKQ